ncbi:MAG: response regulator, partial [Pseudobacter sp.]|uniref:response regulator n=1 Tax=Pseudobacter sp. TaxID=2045420 RepID=UPI003F8090F1
MIKVVLYEDNPQLREGLTMLLNGSEGFDVIGAFKNCDNVVQEVTSLQPDVILMDIDMPGTNGIQGLKLVRQQHSDVKILMLTVFDDNKNVFEAVKNGANGYLLKKTPPAKLLEYIQEAHTGGAPMSSSIATQVLRMFSELHSEASSNYYLSER